MNALMDAVFAGAAGIVSFLLLVMFLVLAVVACTFAIVMVAQSIGNRRGRAEVLSLFLFGIDEDEVSIEYSGSSCFWGDYPGGQFLFTANDHADGTRDLVLRSTDARGNVRFVSALAVPKDDIGQPLSRAWIKLGRLANSEARRRASA